MDVTTERDGEVLFAGVPERIDGSAAAAFEKSLRDAIAESDRAVIVDFGGCPCIGSAGLRVILTIARLLRGRDAELALCGLSDPIQEMFRIGGFDRLVPIYDTRADARVALGV